MNRSARLDFATFISTPLDTVLARHRSQPPRQAAFELFERSCATVPAYPRWLSEQGCDPRSIRSPEDFARLPVMTKQNYVQRFVLAERCRSGALEACDMIAVSSGSTGTPTFWPRNASDELAVARRFEQVFVDSFRADERRTLAVICFALGTWVGGLYTEHCCRLLAARGLPITVVAPGNNKAEILRVLPELAPAFDQVVLLGYPPFLKDVIDSGRAQGSDFAAWNIKLVTAGEVFSEAWRDLVAQRVGSRAPCYDFASLYGTADAGVLGNETPLSIAIRRQLAARPELAQEIFGQARLPTLVQYDPLDRYFEAHDGKLLFSGDNGVPLVRYAILDSGGVLTHDELLGKLAAHGLDPYAALRAASAAGAAVTDAQRGARDLPFVYVFGRSDFTVSYYGANVFPENISVALEAPELAAQLTGKFVLEVQSGADQNAQLAITVELAPSCGASEELAQRVSQSVVRELSRQNSEWKQYVPDERKPPRVTLLPTGDASYFPVGVKHRYTRKS